MELLLSLLVSFFVSADPASSEVGSLRFMENPEVSVSGEVYLKDIASLDYLTKEDQEILGTIKVADSYEELKKMSSRDIMKRVKPKLRAYENHCECKLRVTIPHAMVFRSLPGGFAVDKVQSTIERELKKECPSCEYEISPLNVIRGEVPAQYTRWNVDVRPTEWRGPTMVRVYFDDQAFSPLVLQSLIKIKKPVLKLKRNVNMGSAVNDSDYEVVMTDVTYDSAQFAQVVDLAGMETKRTLGKGTSLVLADLIASNLIRAGQPVSVEVQNNSFLIEMMGVAQKNGRMGDKIPVRINKTQKTISAEIVSPQRVRM